MEKTFYIDKEQYKITTATWKAKHDHTAADQVIYNVLRCKPIDRGFCEKQKNILGNDPWFAFNSALKTAIWQATQVATNSAWYGESTKQSDARKLAYFKETFGFDMPNDLREKLDGNKK